MAVLEQPVANHDPFADRIGGKLAPEGTFQCVIEDIVDEFGVQRRKFESDEMETLDVTTFLFRFQDGNGGVHRISSRRMRISGHEKSSLFGFLKSILGRAPKMGWDYVELKGHSCLITVEHLPRRDGQGVFAAIASLSPLPPGMGDGQRSEVGGQMSGGGGVNSNAEHRSGEPGQGPSVDGDPSTPGGDAGTGEEIPY